MSHHPPIEPFTPSPEAQVPHPVLQAALDNLDVRLEEELTRYRRRRRAEPDQRRPGAPLRAGIRNPEVRLPGEAVWAKNPAIPAAIGAVAPTPQPIGTVPEPRRTGAVSAPKPVPPPSVVASMPKPPQAIFSEAVTIAPEPAVTSAPHEPEPQAGIASYAQQRDLSAFEPDTAIQRFVHQPGVDVSEEYLASSEELLKSIAEEIPERRAQEGNLLDTLLTPLGVGSMLLLLLSSATLGYVIMNPSSLSFLSASRSQPSGGSPASSGEQAKVTVPTTPIPNAPPTLDLAADEFHDVNLNTLSTLPKDGTATSPVASPSAKPEVKPKTATQSSTAKTATAESSTQPESSVDRSSVATASQPAPAIVQQNELPAVPVESKPPAAPEPAAPEPAAPEPTTSEPASRAPAESESSAPEPKASAAAEPSSAPAQSHYYVVADYSGDSSLAHARTAVPDAYVQNLPAGGAKIKLGAFSSEARAQEQIQELQRQGIPAQIYHP